MRMNILTLLMACATTLPVLSADGVDTKVTGRVTAAPCVFNGGNSNMNIDLGSIQATSMFTPGSSPNPVSLNLLFTGYPPGTLGVMVCFSGMSDLEAGMNYHQSSGTAIHVTIAMSDATTGVLMDNGSSITQNIAADRTARMPMKVMVTPMAERPTPDSIRTVVILTIQCN